MPNSFSSPVQSQMSIFVLPNTSWGLLQFDKIFAPINLYVRRVCHPFSAFATVFGLCAFSSCAFIFLLLFYLLGSISIMFALNTSPLYFWALCLYAFLPNLNPTSYQTPLVFRFVCKHLRVSWTYNIGICIKFVCKVFITKFSCRIRKHICWCPL